MKLAALISARVSTAGEGGLLSMAFDIANMGNVVSLGEDGQKELYVLTLMGELRRIIRVNP